MVTKTTRIYLPAIITVTIIISSMWYIFKRKRKKWHPPIWKEIGSVLKLIIYPLKSGRRIELQNAECLTYGLKQIEDSEHLFQLTDRSLIVFNEDEHELRTARTYPTLLLINVSSLKNNCLKLEAPMMESLPFEIPDSNKSKKTSVKFHSGEIVHTVDCGNDAAMWLSQFLLRKKCGVRLGYNDGKFKRDITKIPTFKPLFNYFKHLSNSCTGLYSDLASVLLVNQKSVDDLNNILGNSSITCNNFRPNIIIDGSGMEPYAEDDWDQIKIGDVLFRNIKDCTRCSMTTINPETAIRAKNREPLCTLKTYRISKGPEKAPIMGIYLGVDKCGLLNVGDKVFVSVVNQ